VSCSPARSSTGREGAANIAKSSALKRKSRAAVAVRPILEMGKMLQNSCMFLDWTNWTFWVTAIALVAFGFCLRDIYEQWRFLKVRKDVRDEFREVDDLTRRLQAATERLNKANAKAEAARLKSRPKQLASPRQRQT